jgi:hypothetical protein
MSTIHRPPGGPGETTPAAGGDVLGGFEERLLAELKVTVAQQAAADPDARHAGGSRRRLRALAGSSGPARRLTLAGAASAALATGVAAALAVAPGAPAGGHAAPGAPAGGHAAPGRPPAGHPPSFGPATTAGGVLHNAALAALEWPAGAPRPGQFVYTKLYRDQGVDGSGVLQAWLSVDGVQAGLISGGTPASTGYSPGCRDGWYYYPDHSHLGHRQRCTPAENAAYFPGLPAGVTVLRAYLLKSFGLGPDDASGLLTNIEAMMTSDYLLPRQQAALYEVLARTPGLTVVSGVRNVLGKTGVGIRADTVDKGSIYTIIFDPKTYAPLGMNWTGAAAPMPEGSRGGEVLLQIAIVSQRGQRP